VGRNFVEFIIELTIFFQIIYFFISFPVA